MACWCIAGDARGLRPIQAKVRRSGVAQPHKVVAGLRAHHEPISMHSLPLIQLHPRPHLHHPVVPYRHPIGAKAGGGHRHRVQRGEARSEPVQATRYTEVQRVPVGDHRVRHKGSCRRGAGGEGGRRPPDQHRRSPGHPSRNADDPHEVRRHAVHLYAGLAARWQRLHDHRDGGRITRRSLDARLAYHVGGAFPALVSASTGHGQQQDLSWLYIQSITRCAFFRSHRPEHCTVLSATNRS
ncbi:MAG: hypothetical protein BWY79_02044 [Actinobacteria bacterium ADurb.Bin444]|nr:MAG: hypothetical protein BWY79_02044 [Actinobacteria bacterium ADurb.Bin444]